MAPSGGSRVPPARPGQGLEGLLDRVFGGGSRPSGSTGSTPVKAPAKTTAERFAELQKKNPSSPDVAAGSRGPDPIPAPQPRSSGLKAAPYPGAKPAAKPAAKPDLAAIAQGKAPASSPMSEASPAQRARMRSMPKALAPPTSAKSTPGAGLLSRRDKAFEGMDRDIKAMPKGVTNMMTIKRTVSRPPGSQSGATGLKLPKVPAVTSGRTGLPKATPPAAPKVGA